MEVSRSGAVDRPMAGAMEFLTEPLSPKLKQLLGWWRGLKDAGVLPAREHFNLRDWKAHLPLIGVADVIRDPVSGLICGGTVKVWGTQLSEPFGSDATGQSIGGLDEPFKSRWLAPGLRADATGEPVCTASSILSPGRDFIRFEMLLLPLFGPDARVNRMMVEFSFSSRAS